MIRSADEPRSVRVVRNDERLLDPVFTVVDCSDVQRPLTLKEAERTAVVLVCHVEQRREGVYQLPDAWEHSEVTQRTAIASCGRSARAAARRYVERAGKEPDTARVTHAPQEREQAHLEYRL
eukprot:4544749-Prymnesium_polylepis.1